MTPLRRTGPGTLLPGTLLPGTLLLVFLLTGLPPSVVHAQVGLEAAAQSTAGGRSSAGSARLIGILGQPAPIGQATVGPVTLQSGYLYLLPRGVSPPIIAHTAPPTLPNGREALLSVSILSAQGVAAARLRYHAGNETTFLSLPLTRVGGTYQAVIPAADVTPRGLVYFITATDSAGQTARLPAAGVFSAPVELSAPGLVQPAPQHAGEQPSDYRLFSVPFQPENQTPDDVLADDLGAYDARTWRLFGLEPDQAYAERPNTDPVIPGRAFWLIVQPTGRRIDTGAGRTVPLSPPYALPLNPMWTFIGNPFTFPLSTESLRRASGGPVELRAFTGSWNDPLVEPVTVLQPFEGYAVFNDRSVADTLFFDPTQAAGKRSAPVLAGPAWTIRVRARNGGALDADNRLGLSPDAAPGPDALDRPEPPVVGDFLSVYFPHPEWETLAEAYSTDVRPPGAPGEAWTLAVAARNPGPVYLTFEGLDAVPPALGVRLIDEARHTVHDLRATPRIALAGPLETGRRLKVLVGDAAFLADYAAAFQAPPPLDALVEIFPNPFQASTNVRYGLTEPAAVTLTVFALTGERITTLLRDEPKSAGYHAAVWDGRDAAGRFVASGLYLLHLQAGTRTLIAKMVLLR